MRLPIESGLGSDPQPNLHDLIREAPERETGKFFWQRYEDLCATVFYDRQQLDWPWTARIVEHEGVLSAVQERTLIPQFIEICLLAGLGQGRAKTVLARLGQNIKQLDEDLIGVWCIGQREQEGQKTPILNVNLEPRLWYLLAKQQVGYSVPASVDLLARHYRLAYPNDTGALWYDSLDEINGDEPAFLASFDPSDQLLATYLTAQWDPDQARHLWQSAKKQFEWDRGRSLWRLRDDSFSDDVADESLVSYQTETQLLEVLVRQTLAGYDEAWEHYQILKSSLFHFYDAERGWWRQSVQKDERPLPQYGSAEQLLALLLEHRFSQHGFGDHPFTNQNLRDEPPLVLKY